MYNSLTFYFDIMFDTFLKLTGVLFIILLFGFILSYLGKRITINLYHIFGKKGLRLFTFIGVPIHELGHLIFALLFRHKIIDVKLFDSNPDTKIAGYVKHAYNTRSLYESAGNFFIGIAPIFSSTLFLLLSSKILIPEFYSTVSVIEGNFFSKIILLFQYLLSIKNLTNILFFIFVYISIGICSGISLSKKDIEGSFAGFITLFIISFFINLLTYYGVFDIQVLKDFFININKKLINFFTITLVMSLLSYFITSISAFIFIFFKRF